MDTTLLWALLASVAAIVMAAVTSNWATKYAQLKNALHQLTKLLDELDTALNDDAITVDEWNALYQQAIALKDALKVLIGK